MIRCPKCNAEMPDGTKFCTTCGASLSSAEPTPVPAPETIPEQTA